MTENTNRLELVPAAPPTPPTPMDMLDRAIGQGASIEVLEKLMALQERWERNQARRAFDAALAAAKAQIPIIAKNRQVGFDSKKAGAARTDYWHEDLAEIARTIDPILGQHGLSYRFRTTSNVGEPITVTCIVSHRDGHSEENTLVGPRDESGNKNSIQAIGSTVTYLERYTLRAALGLASSKDDDGAAAGAPVGPTGPITPGQVEEIKKLTENFSSERMQKFFTYFGIESIGSMPAKEFERARAELALAAKREAEEALAAKREAEEPAT